MTTAKLIDGKAFAGQMRENIGRRVASLKEEHGPVPGLAAVLVGEDPASQVYVRNKEKQTAEAGMASVGRKLQADISQEDLLAVVAELNADPSVHGILVQLPLPDHISDKAVIETINVAKDVDGFHPVNVGALSSGDEGLVPCTPRGCMMLLKDTLGDLTGKNAVVVGRSNIVGKPIAQLLLAANCTVTIAHSRTQDLPGLCRTADILIAAVGRAQMIKGDWIKPGATVIDVGINRIDADDGKSRLVGDVDFNEAAQVAGAITPVPGGVGPMTIACLLENTLIACCRQNGLEVPGA
ncbi:MAG: bifunctional methylenetetrahydrofolate dehydrogenase/methenyltetrahydrofolate cyclohydrolase FolD [Rhodospirillaceae bacterium]|nr:bifunctional methylenetetrahydrofolate dehydrogenase/methenyltetrahydrofolate cyclohydrolase FolD [Rhodospirillaceae bacterium]|tara:strand:- start:4660 stop:5547 length:888 start_codon:yes stop_codon:yes gene_type:complete